MSSQGGREGVKICQFYVVKRQLKGGEGVKNCRFCDDIVYGQPLIGWKMIQNTPGPRIMLFLGLGKSRIK